MVGGPPVRASSWANPCAGSRVGQAEGDWRGGLGPVGRILNVLYRVQMSTTTNSEGYGAGVYLFFFIYFFLPGLFLLWVETSLVPDRAEES